MLRDTEVAGTTRETVDSARRTDWAIRSPRGPALGYPDLVGRSGGVDKNSLGINLWAGPTEPTTTHSLGPFPSFFLNRVDTKETNSVNFGGISSLASPVTPGNLVFSSPP